MTRSPALALLALGTVGMWGCGTDPVTCPTESVPAVAVEVRDAVTDDYEDALTERDDATLVGAFDRPGTYSAHVEADGYAAWNTEGLTAVRGECHVETVAVTARLTPVP